ncbi:MAG: cation:proton antiporter [Sphingobacteriaceae bacterium]|nr:cation:proton antiporter [Sphingobacteriaceae bacterium]
MDQYLPLKNPVLILSVTLLIILFAPLLFRRFKIPGIIGLILAGVFIGPNCLHIIESTNSFELLSKTGLLYIMFLAGLEIDTHEFKHNRNKSIVFGFFTFIIPISIGYIVSIYVFHFSIWQALLLASMFSTHTLLSFPIVSSMGIIKNRAVQITFGGTLITDAAVLILLGVITNIVSGEIDASFWIRIILSLCFLVFSTLYLLPRISRWFFRNIEAQASSQYIYVLAMVFISGFLSEIAGVEPIIGAFLAGLGLNKVIPHNSILMNRVNFIGNTLFIPFFLISAGMLVDLSMYFKSSSLIIFAVILCLIGFISKYLAAWLTAFIYKFNANERSIIYGLSVSRAAATLAVVKVGFDIGLFDQNVINGTMLLILLSCLVSSIVTERAARKIAIHEKEVSHKNIDRIERILIPVSNPENIQRLIDFSLLIKSSASNEPLYPLSIVEDNEEADEQINVVKKTIEGAIEQISSGDKKVEVLKKVDLSIVDGIARTAKAYNISDILISYKSQQSGTNIFGSIAENLLNKCKQIVIISKILQPLNSFKRVIIILSPNIELENGFFNVSAKINSIIKQLGSQVHIFGLQDTLNDFAITVNDNKKQLFKYFPLTDYENFNILKIIAEDDLILIFNGRTHTVGFDFHIEQISKDLNKQSEFSSFVLFYPEISKSIKENVINTITVPAFDKNVEKVKHITEKITGIFKKDPNE